MRETTGVTCAPHLAEAKLLDRTAQHQPGVRHLSCLTHSNRREHECHGGGLASGVAEAERSRMGSTAAIGS